MSESGPPTRKFQPGDEIERPVSGWSDDRDYYVLGYTRAGEVVVENSAGTLFGVWAEDDLDPKHDLESIISKWLHTECSHVPREHNHEQCLARTLREAGAIAEGW